MSTVNTNIANAISAYNTASRSEAKAASTGDASAAVGGGNGDGGDNFASLVRNAINEAVKIGQHSEKLSMDAMTDRADLSKVVTAVAEAEVTLQTAVTVRDKVLEAYKDIIRMPM